ncbi:helix-turn-helix domain-containing protein [Enterococcus caccae]|uniref:HTH cro/C1-type domain-containing protein n=1 Tax=Enterococcus caccae ATCC BAA-1240 TaxID=1158612 RepID=R3WCY2_9ENTE|nr:helix-turn-helix transcriptional regulator [Enterococcus caccae]EOL45761.1 hypothetical protein UC7_01558 [Enterococcus caccae ATCC BAA-1240]EOT60957.1 hypothetical protein I580_01859 [Enterococcus caccae ATCC BAA-1240]OJG28005.1 hypothetical protein RU98_GL002214 [Enterococcus caccae]
MTLFDRIKTLANKQGKSINDIEREMGYSKNTLYRLKRTNPSSETLEKIADHFKCSTDYLLGRVETPENYYFSDASIGSIKKIYEGKDSNYLNLIEKLQQLDDDEIQALSNMAEVMISKKNKS